MRSLRRLWVLLAVTTVSGACGDSFQGSTGGGGTGGTGGPPPPADLAGDYTISVTDGDNGCNLANWMKGTSTKNIDFTVTQSEAHAVGLVGGLAGTYMDLVLGSHKFEGEVTGDAFSMTDYGTNQGTMNGCSYTINATIDGTIDG